MRVRSAITLQRIFIGTQGNGKFLKRTFCLCNFTSPLPPKSNHCFHHDLLELSINKICWEMGEKREKVCISIICVGILGIYRRTRHQEAPTFLLSPLSPLLQANENGNFLFFVSGWKWRRLSAAFVFSDEVLVLQEDYDFWCRKSESGLYLFLVVKWGK